MAVWSYFACTPTASPCQFRQTPHTTAHHCVARHAAFDPPLSPQGANVGMLRLHFTKCCCYILPARPPPAPDRFARHHTPQHAVAKQGLWRLWRFGSVTLVYIAQVPPAYFPGTTHHGVQILHTYVQFYRHHTPQCIAKCREVMSWCVVPDKNLKECKLTVWCRVKSRQFAGGCKYPRICTQRQVYPFYCEAWCLAKKQGIHRCTG